MSYHTSDRCLTHSGEPTWACPDCILEHDQSEAVAESLPTHEYLRRFTPIEVVSGMRAEGDPDGD